MAIAILGQLEWIERANAGAAESEVGRHQLHTGKSIQINSYTQRLHRSRDRLAELILKQQLLSRSASDGQQV